MIGSRNRLAFDLVPVEPSWERRYLPERAGWAGLAIWVDGRNLCRHVLPGGPDSVNDYVYVPLAPLAAWLVTSWPAIAFEERPKALAGRLSPHTTADVWFDLKPPQGVSEDEWFEQRDVWWQRHFVRAGADGAFLPNLSLARQDERLVISWAESEFLSGEAPDFLANHGLATIPWADGEGVVREFVCLVAESLVGAGLIEEYAWTRLEDPLGAAAPSTTQALEFLTGHDLESLGRAFGVTDEASLLDRLGLRQGDDPARSVEVQILRDVEVVQRETIEAVVETAEWARHTRREAVGWNGARGIALDAAGAATTLEEAGQMAAQEVRRWMSLDGEALPRDLGAFLGTYGLRIDAPEVEGLGTRMMVGAIPGGNAACTLLRDKRTAHEWARRFETSRALGHILLDPARSGVIGAASSSLAQVRRRRRSGAFAAEFLLPESALGRAGGAGLDRAAEPAVFQRLLDEYGVGASTAAHQLLNRGWLSSEEVRDELIQEFSSSPEGSKAAPQAG